VIITKASGMSTLAFANKYLFDPLKIERVEWIKVNDGYYDGTAGFFAWHVSCKSVVV
jgi:hypothetical protein